jgi:acyl-CoA thioester hydrolase
LPPSAPAGIVAPLAAYPWRTTLAARFSDSDARRLASDQWLSRCTEQVRVEFLDQVFSARPRGVGGMMVAHVVCGGCTARRPACGPKRAGVAHLGDRSVALRTTIVDAGQCVATCESVMVAIDTQTRRSAALPQQIRDPLRLTGCTLACRPEPVRLERAVGLR